MNTTRNMRSGCLVIASLLLVISLTLVSCGGGGGGGGGVGGNPNTPIEPSAQEKIAAALAAGTIDYGTSLMYRAYAFYGDARLPAAYLGSGSQEEDNTLRSEIITAGTSSAGLKAALEPFTVRPDDPLSWYNETAAAKARPGLGAKAFAPASGWTWKFEQRSTPVRVWAQSNGDPTYELNSTMAISDTLDIIDKIWTPMTALMGEPVLDDLHGDIDIYIVDWMSSVHRGEDRTARGFASTFSDVPAVGNASSGFILIPRSTVVSKRFHTTVIHEFFHVLQKAHNNNISNSWFTEASARWASVYYDRTLAPWKNGRVAYDEAYHTFTERFQKSTESLNTSTPGPHMYDAYIWAYFLEQETGGPGVIGKLWTQLESASTIAEADNAIDFIYPFIDNFRIFAVRNVNTEFLPGDPLPLSQRYITLDPEFRDDKKEPPYGGGPLTGDSELPYSATLEPLSADYLKFTVSDPAVKQVVFDLSALVDAAAMGLDVDALIKTKGKNWEKRDLNGQTELKFCFDKDGEALEDIRFIVSNHKYGPGESVLAMFTARSYKTPCAGTWSGNFSYTNAYDDGYASQSVVWSGTVTWGHPVIVNSWTTTFTPDSVVSTVTVDGVTDNGCTFHEEKAVAMSEFIASQDVMTLFSDGAYTAGLTAATTVTVNYVCPSPWPNYSSDIPLGVGWNAATTDSSLPQLDINNHMKGNFVQNFPPNYLSWTWDLAYTVP